MRYCTFKNRVFAAVRALLLRREIECVCYERKLRSLRRDKNLIVALNGLHQLGEVLLRAVVLCHGIIYPRNEHVVLRRTWYPFVSPTTMYANRISHLLVAHTHLCRRGDSFSTETIEDCVAAFGCVLRDASSLLLYTS